MIAKKYFFFKPQKLKSKVGRGDVNFCVNKFTMENELASKKKIVRNVECRK